MKKSTRARGRREGRPCTWRGSRRGTGGCRHLPWLGTARSKGGSWSRVRRQVGWGGPVPSPPRGTLRSPPTRAAPAPHPAPPVAVAGTPVTIWYGQQSFNVVSHVLTEGYHLCTLCRHIWDEQKINKSRCMETEHLAPSVLRSWKNATIFDYNQFGLPFNLQNYTFSTVVVSQVSVLGYGVFV